MHVNNRLKFALARLTGILDAYQRARHISRRHSRSVFDQHVAAHARAKQIARVVVIILGVISLLKYIAVF